MSPWGRNCCSTLFAANTGRIATMWQVAVMPVIANGGGWTGEESAKKATLSVGFFKYTYSAGVGI
jgi:hypothetical protein